ncbi:hypothetical protein CLU79DRAFT_376451 [Phycomyces nitens]|nr:hypothetical protein CLU79DRAFT_376451 [Phycomyces nitens]
MAIPLYYIRFFKPPPDRVECNQPFSVVWTVETDLGDESYWQSIPVTCTIAECHDPSIRLRVFSDKTKTKKEVLQPWTKSIDLDYNPVRGGVVCTRLMVESPVANTSIQLLFKLGGKARRHPVWTNCGLFENNDCLWIIPAWTCPITLMEPTKKTQRVQTTLPEPVSSQQAERILSVPGGTVRICEDAFQSIARHVWDCGLGMCSYLFQQVQKGTLDFDNKSLIELVELLWSEYMLLSVQHLVVSTLQTCQKQ